MQENKKGTKTLLSGVLNIVIVFLTLAITVACFIVLNADILGKTGDNDETLGFVVTIIVFIPFAIIALVPIIIDCVYKTIFSIVLIGNANKLKNNESCQVKNGFYVASLVFKIISTIALGFEALFISVVINSGGLLGLSLVFMFLIIIVAILQILALFIENASKKELGI